MIIYIHGFNSSPASHKSRLLQERLAQTGSPQKFSCPALPHRPQEAMAILEGLVMKTGVQSVTLVGSSLGGFYATWLTETTGCRSVLVNPAITPHEGLRSYLGPQKNLYTGQEYELTEDHLLQMQALYIPRPERMDNYLLIHTTGDELLDWRVAVERFRGCRQIVVDGSDHGFSEFGDYVDSVLEFAAP
jgi:predicted esterase YcpF (UPF0227 family)